MIEFNHQPLLFRRPVMKRSIFVVSVLTVIGYLAAASPAWPANAKIYVTLPQEDGVAVVDAASYDAWGFIKTGKYPAKLVATNDGKYIFVTLHYENKVQVINTDKDEVVKTIEVGDHPYEMDKTPDGKYLVVGNTRGESVSIIDIEKLKETGKIKTLGEPFEVRVSPDGRDIYAVNYNGQIQVFDLASMKETARIDIPQDVNQILFSRSGDMLFVNSLADHEVSIMDRSRLKPVAKIKSGVEGLALSPDGNELWSGGPDDRISVYSLVKNEVVATPSRGGNFTNLEITFSPDGKVVLAGPSGDSAHNVNVYDADKKEKTGEIVLKGAPGGILYLVKP
jgi:YVTN family beta-propeller protein